MTLRLHRHLDLLPDTAAAAAARDAALLLLQEAADGGQPVPGAVADVIVLITSELVTNAIRHTGGPCTLDLLLDDHGIDIDVTDSSPVPPRTRAPHTDGAGGWGWILVRALAEDTAVRPTPQGGKTVHARVARGPEP